MADLVEITKEGDPEVSEYGDAALRLFHTTIVRWPNNEHTSVHKNHFPPKAPAQAGLETNPIKL